MLTNTSRRRERSDRSPPTLRPHTKGEPRRRLHSAPLRVVCALALLALSCQPSGDNRARLVVATSWGPAAAAVLHRELLSIAKELEVVDVELRALSVSGLQDSLSRGLAAGDENRPDLVIVPNAWLGQLAQRGSITELPMSRVAHLQEQLVGQALLAVSERDRVLAFPVSAEVLALVYNPHYFTSPPASIEELLATPLPPGTLPFACDLMNPFHMVPLLGTPEASEFTSGEGLTWSRASLAELFSWLEPIWKQEGAWRACRGEDLESLHVQLFAEGRLASFLGGPWLLEALDRTGQPVAVEPIPSLSRGGAPGHSLVSYQCAAVLQQSAWVDLALDLGERLTDQNTNDRLNRLTRRLPVRADAYRSQEAVRSAGTVGFLRALENGRPLGATTTSLQALDNLADLLRQLTLRASPPTAADSRKLLTGGTP